MFGYAIDGQHFLYQDGYGLTRLTLPRAVKTDRALAGTRLDVCGALGVARRRYDRLAAFDPITLEKRPLPVGEYGSFAPHNNGSHFIDYGSGTPRLIDAATNAAIVLECDEAVPELAPFDLGRPWPRTEYAHNAARCPMDGPALVLQANTKEGGGQLFCVDLTTPEAPRFLWRARAPRPVGTLSLEPGSARSFVHAFDPGLRRAVIYAIDHSTLAVERKELASLVAPAWSGTRWCFVDEGGAVCSASWDALDAPQRWTLPAGVQPYGTLLCHHDTTLFVPRDGESFIDVREKKSIPRKLAAGESSMRAVVNNEVERYDRWLGEDGGRLACVHAERNKRSGAIEWSALWDVGTGSLSSHLAVGELVETSRERNAGSEPTTFSGVSSSRGLRHNTLDDVRAAFSALDRRGGKLVRALSMLRYPLAAWFEPAHNDAARRGLARPERAFSVEAATVLLRAAFAQSAVRERLQLAPRVDEWAAQRWTADELAAQRFDPAPFEHPQIGEHEHPHAMAYVALDLLGADALPVLIRWLVEAPLFFAAHNPHIIGAVAARMMQYYPETELPFVDACARSQEQGQRIMQSATMTAR
jgi:hypothetical protein